MRRISFPILFIWILYFVMQVWRNLELDDQPVLRTPFCNITLRIFVFYAHAASLSQLDIVQCSTAFSMRSWHWYVPFIIRRMSVHCNSRIGPLTQPRNIPAANDKVVSFIRNLWTALDAVFHPITCQECLCLRLKLPNPHRFLDFEGTEVITHSTWRKFFPCFLWSICLEVKLPLIPHFDRCV